MSIFNIIEDNIEDFDLDSDFDKDYEEALSKSKLSQKEYDEISNKEWHVNKIKKEYNARKNILDYSNFTLKDQTDTFKKLKDIFHSKNNECLAFLGEVLGDHIKEYVKKDRVIDEYLIEMIVKSSILDEDDRSEFYEEQKKEDSKRTRIKDSEQGSRNYKLAVQKKLYVLLLKNQYSIVGGRMRLGIIFYKYIEDSIDRRALINKYLLYRIDDYVNEGIE